MNISKFLAKSLGIYFIIISLAMLVNMNQFANYVNQLINDFSLLFVTGFFTLILGILIVVSHPIWQWNWRVVITIIGWIALFKGAILIFYPQLINQMTLAFLHNTTIAYVSAGFDLLLGILLSYYGFKNNEST